MNSAQMSTRDRSQTASWGRYERIDWLTWFFSVFLLIFAPVIVIYYALACLNHQCSFFAAITHLQFGPLLSFDWEVFGIYLAWVLAQAILYAILPGPIGVGQETPAGYVLRYKVNGLLAYTLTHVGLASCAYLGWIPADFIASHWRALIASANIVGFTVMIGVFVKAKVYPTHPEDCKVTTSWLYDLYMGVEFNPRLAGPESPAPTSQTENETTEQDSSSDSSSDDGSSSDDTAADQTAPLTRRPESRKLYPRTLTWNKLWDFKLFFNGRPGIIAWTLIDLSFAAGQYNRYGYVTNSMILVIILHAAYVVDFFYGEDWYLRTIDIAHDHFGFYLAWGDCVWLPVMYTLQAQYLFWHPVDLPHWQFMLIAAIGAIGYYIFRTVNNQKDLVRRTNGQCKIWGKKPTVIRTKYTTKDGNEHQSLLLASGFWGLSRHFNYVGDLLMSLAMCLCCSLGPVHPLPEHADRPSWINAIDYGIVPYFYIYYMTILLVHRLYRDDARCRDKYGEYWAEYCKIVKYKLVPGIF